MTDKKSSATFKGYFPKRTAILVVAGLFSWLSFTSTASALAISDIDLNSFDFDVTSYDTGSAGDGLAGDATASGTSNGVGWSISPTNLWNGRTTTNGTFSFSALPNNTDNLHASIDFELTFGTGINNLLVALSNDNCCDSVNFGIAPTETSGNISVSGTQIELTSASGGLALYTGLGNVTSLSHTNNNGLSDGFDLAFHVAEDSTAVPAPGTLGLLGIGLAGLGFVARRRVT